MAKKITAIPATKSKFTSQPLISTEKRKVCGYARVSTDHEEQQSSYEAQMEYYTEYIQSRPDWEFVGMYSDEGITATSTTHRDGFKQMVEDALAGKIDLIITKSVSRFARNTVDSLTTVRKLKEKGIEIYFEKENIWTLDAKGELLITIMSSLAQEESRSISENTTWGKRKQFADGFATVPFKHFLGYDRGKEKGEFVINEEEAETIRLIYKLFLAGLAPCSITKELENRGIKAPGGGDKWCDGTVRSILTNEKYKGDALQQKSYISDFLTKKQVKNNGEIPQYYVEGHHEAIITPEVFALVQDEMKRRAGMARRYSGVTIYSSKVVCADCGNTYGTRTFHSTDKYKHKVWQCAHKYGDGPVCRTPNLTTEQIREFFIEAVNEVIKNRDEIFENIEHLQKTANRTDKLEKELEVASEEVSKAMKVLEDLIEQNARVVLNQETYAQKYNELTEDYNAKKKRYEEIQEEIHRRQSADRNNKNFLRIMKGRKKLIKDFDEDLWGGLLLHIVMERDGTARVKFKQGMEITIKPDTK